MAIRNSLSKTSERRVDGSGLSVLRVLFGTLMFGATLRFWSKGWIDTFYIQPDYYFRYAWFRHLPIPTPEVLYGLFGLTLISAALLALGIRTRFAALVFFISFLYVELLDKSLYLNHYYLVSIVAFLLIWVPSDRYFAVTTHHADRTVPFGAYLLFRIQVGLVYFFAGIAKLNSDWLLRAEPLHTWLASLGHLEHIGWILADHKFAYFCSWAGFAFDLSIPFLLLMPRIRFWVFCVACFFHLTVWLLFPIGMFSFIMMACATVFFAPNWARRFASSQPQPDLPSGSSRLTQSRLQKYYISGCFWILLQCIIPMRFMFYPGYINWTEHGFRFSWRVMLVEKTGSLEYRIQLMNSGRSFYVNPRAHLVEHQMRILPTQPDMIIEYAQFLKRQFEAKYNEPAGVFADAFVAFNGRPTQRYLSGDVDLGSEQVKPEDAVLPLKMNSDH